MAKSMRPGGGGRFAKLVQGGMTPKLAAWIGREKYGKKKFQRMAAKGRSRRARYRGPKRKKKKRKRKRKRRRRRRQ